jgi:hypothetical protein
MTNWKLAVGRGVTWTTSGHGSLNRVGEIVAHVPAGVSIKAALMLASDPLPAGVLDISKIDRYAVMVPRLNSRGVPVKTGTTEIKTPTKAMLESQCGG